MCEAIREIRGACSRSTGRAVAMRRWQMPHTHAHRGLVDECSYNSSIRARLRLRARGLKFLDLLDEGEVVETALSLWAQRPLEAPLSILDRAMARFEPHDLDFAFEADQLHPPHPFAELIRLAFAPELNAGARILTSIKANASRESSESAPKAMPAAWQRTIMCFADRYGLWLPFEPSEGEDEDSNPM